MESFRDVHSFKPRRFLAEPVVFVLTLFAFTVVTADFTDLFDHSANTVLPGHDDHLIGGISPDKCADLCLKGTTSVPEGECLSFDYRKVSGGRCQLSRANKDTAGQALSYNVQFDHYEMKDIVSFFDVQTDRVLLGHNDVDVRPATVSPRTCALRCLLGEGSLSAGSCLSFDLDSRPARCQLSGDNQNTAGQPLDTNARFDYYQRNDFCAPDPCVHGTCSSETSSYTCTCDVGWGGVTCDTAIITPQSCADLSAIGIQGSNSYHVGHPQPFQVSCDMDTDGGGWTVIQRRQDGSVLFNKPWVDYVQGFGNADGELWLGLEHLHSLTTQTHELYIYLEDWEANSRVARYSTFSVGDSSGDYRLTLSGYSLSESTVDDDLTPARENGRHSINNRGFATTNHGGFSSCANSYGQGGWWYPASCGLALLNGQYFTACSATTPPSCSSANGIVWKSWKTFTYSLKKAIMMIRPGSFPSSSLNTCQNGGTLTPGTPGSGVYTCVCPAGFGGTYCEQDTDTCSPNPCHAQATCTDNPPPALDATCTCNPGYTGDGMASGGTGCSEINACLPDPCHAQATCTDNPPPADDATCICYPGYTGDGLASGTGCIDTNACSPNPCHAQATCTDKPPPALDATCTCNPGYTGDGLVSGGTGCPETTSSSVAAIIGGTVAAVALLLILGAGLIFYRRRQKSHNQAGNRDVALTDIGDPPETGSGNEAFVHEVDTKKGHKRLSQLVTVHDVKDFLEANGLKELTKSFKEHDVDGRALRGMNDAILKDLILKAGPRARLTALLTEMKTPANPDDPVVSTSNLNYWEIPRANLKLGRRLGRGQFGEVRLGKVQNRGVTTTVAVKTLKSSASDSDKKDLLGELEILVTVGRHDNIISLVGACTKDDPLTIVVEYASNGCLRDWLKSNSAEEYQNQPAPTSDLPMEQLIQFGIDVAAGMSHLAAMQCVHRDLAARNILLGENLVAKVSDFGLSRDIYESEEYVKTAKSKLPLRWMAYESLFYSVYTTQSDVWSFGVLLWEIMTMGHLPYEGMRGKQMMDVIKDGGRLEKPLHCPDDLFVVMQDCWKTLPDDRPSFLQLKTNLDRIIQAHKTYASLLHQ